MRMNVQPVPTLSERINEIRTLTAICRRTGSTIRRSSAIESPIYFVRAISYGRA